ncbi:DUF6230 family protein [Nocardioides sp. DS6]|uniref:DUF6230 family protein n=1 Tax=Nocardioides eburneus TaxID=3231482 RepID=A0ABV3T1M7_9ACTN
MTTSVATRTSPAPEPRNGTRWGRAGMLATVAAAAVVGIATLVDQHVLALYLDIDSEASPASFNTTALVGQDVGFGMVPTSVNGTQKSVLRAGFASATLDGFCLSQTQSLGALGSFTLKVTAGNGTSATDISASNASFDLVNFTAADAGIVLSGQDQIGLATSDITTTKTGTSYDSNPLGGPETSYGKGWIGIDASKGSFTKLKGKLYSARVLGNISLPRLSIKAFSGTSGDASACDAATTAYQN